MKNMTLKELHSNLGEIMKVCPALADNVVAVANSNERDLHQNLRVWCSDVNSVIIGTDGDDFYVTILYHD